MGNVGRKNNYFKKVQPFLKQIDKWLNNGATEKQVAEALNIAYSSWNNYKNQFKELYDLCDKPRVGLVLELRGSLVNKALGFTRTTKKAVKLKEVIYDNGKRLRETERIEFYDEETYYPPETNAIYGALRIYDPDKADYDIQVQRLELNKEEYKLKEKVVKEQLF